MAVSAIRAPTDTEKKRYVTKHIALIQQMAADMARDVPLFLDADDLTHEGVIGLLKALEKFDPRRNRRFMSFAEWRIRGAMVDAIRTSGGKPRSVIAKEKRIAKARHALTQTLGRLPHHEEIADHLGIPPARLDNWRRRITTLRLHRGGKKESHHQHQDDTIQIIEKGNALTTALSLLPDREKQMIVLYYLHDHSLKEIGKIFNVKEARVCQIRKKALALLKVELENIL